MVENTKAKAASAMRPAKVFGFLYSLLLFNSWMLANEMLACLLNMHESAVPISQLYLRIAILMKIFKNTIPPEPPPDPAAG